MPMKVPYVYDSDKHQSTDRTKDNILQAIFPDYDPVKNRGWNGYNGVEIGAITTDSWHPRLEGISLKVNQSGDRPAQRRVMIKGDEIDEVAIKAKYEELRKVVLEEEAKRKQRENNSNQARALVERIVQAVGVPDLADWRIRDGRNVYINDYTPDLIKVVANVTSEQRAHIEEILGETKTERLELRLTEEQAIAVCKYMLEAIK